MNESDRAVQFAPFASLRGYYGMIAEQEKITQPKRELSDDECIILSQKLSGIKKGDMLRVVYYSGAGYKTAVGMCTKIDFVMHTLHVLKTEISFDSILSVESE